MIFTIRVTTGQERIVSEMLLKKARAEKLNIYSLVSLENIKGYLFVEATDENTVVKLIQRVKHVKGILKRPITTAEIENLIKTTKQQVVTLEIGDTVEMISGPFKGEKAKITKIDEAKDEVTVELIEIAVPIPVTVKTKTIRLFQKSGDEN
jgi:transcriptional antiterminator NusG